MTHYVRWSPCDNLIESPLGRIDVATDPLVVRRHALTVVASYSTIVGNPKRDLEIIFHDVVAFRFKDESYGLAEMPFEPVPRCADAKWAQFTWPFIEVLDSEWHKMHTADVLRTGDVDPYREFWILALSSNVRVLTRHAWRTRWVDAPAEDSYTE